MRTLQRKNMDDIMPETTGCQLWGIIGAFIAHKPLTDTENDAIKRRLFAYTDIMETHTITLTDIQQLKTTDEIRNIINELTTPELNTIFY